MYFFHTQNFTSQLWKIQEIHSKKKKEKRKGKRQQRFAKETQSRCITNSA